MINPNEDIWYHDGFETEEEFIKDAKENYDVLPGEKIYIGKCHKSEINGICFGDVLENVENAMEEDVGEIAEDWDISTTIGSHSDRQPIYDKYDKKLRKLVLDYIKEIDEEPRFDWIGDVKEVMIL